MGTALAGGSVFFWKLCWTFPQDGGHQAGEAVLQHVKTERVAVLDPFHTGVQDAGLPQDLKMVRHAGFWPATQKGRAVGFLQAVQVADDAQTDRVRHGPQKGQEGDVFRGGVMIQRSHEIVYRESGGCLSRFHCSMLIEQKGSVSV